VVAHVADAERAALELAVAVGDLEAARFEALDEPGHREALGADAGHGGRGVLLGGEGVQAARARPGQRAALHAAVLGEARLPGGRAARALARRQGHAGADVLELARQGEVVRDRGRGGRLALDVALDHGHRVEREAALWRRARVSEVALGGAHDADPGRQGERFLHPGEGEVEAVGVEAHRGARDPAHQVDAQERARVGRQELAQGRERSRSAGRGLARDDRQRFEGTLLGQDARDLVRRDDRAPGRLQCSRRAAERQRDLVPALGEGSVHQAQHPPAPDSQERRLHHRGGRGGVRRDLRRRARSQPEGEGQVRVDALEQGGHLRRAVADHRPRHLGEDLGADFGRAGDPEHGRVQR